MNIIIMFRDIFFSDIFYIQMRVIFISLEIEPMTSWSSIYYFAKAKYLKLFFVPSVFFFDFIIWKRESSKCECLFVIRDRWTFLYTFIVINHILEIWNFNETSTYTIQYVDNVNNIC